MPRRLSFELPLLDTLSEIRLPSLPLLLAGCHGHQLIPMTFSADLDCSDLLALICSTLSPLSSNVPHGCRIFSDDFIAERFRPGVRKIVLALDTADSQDVRFDVVLQRTNSSRRCVPFCKNVHVDGECVMLLLRQ